MSQGSTPRQADLFRDTASFVEPLVREDSIHALLHRECQALFPDELFLDRRGQEERNDHHDHLHRQPPR
jgi:hypothetical protein